MRVAPADRLHARVAAVNAAIASRGLDALVVTSLSNIAYLTGFFASAAAAIVTAEAITLIGDGRYADALAERGRECPFLRTHQLPAGAGYDEQIVALLGASGLATVAFEAPHLTVQRYNFVIAALGKSAPRCSFQPTEGIVEAARVTKDKWEQATLREGAARLSDVAKCILPKALAGRTESDVAAEIESELRRVGFQRPAFDTIVAAGANAAQPHARAGQRRIEAGELVVVDFGGVLDGYNTDLTRTVVAGVGGARERRLIEQVVEAQARAYEAVRPGAAPEAVDRAARETLNRHGIGDAFTHGTGHGLGLDVHEAPRVSPTRPSHVEPALADGMVLTLEPGAYFPGWGGARIEDDVLVTAEGAEWLTDVPRFFT